MENVGSAAQKLASLKTLLGDMNSVVVAYSGGVDSTFLLKVAVDTLGDRALGLTAVSESYPEWELKEARSLAQAMGAQMIEVNTYEMNRAEYRSNAGDRCYYCKTELFEAAHREALKLQAEHLCYGAIPDDLGDFRPGMQAASERQVSAPLIDVGLSKKEIRLLSKEMGLPTWDKPATACLSSRFPFGVEITPERIRQVGQCEERLRLLGLRHFRARYHENLVRLELGSEELEAVFSQEGLREQINAACKDVGFRFVTIDLEGYRQGSANALVMIDG